MRRTTARQRLVVVLLGLVLPLCAAAPADARWGLGYLERLSGPGPFNLFTVQVNVKCLKNYNDEQGEPSARQVKDSSCKENFSQPEHGRFLALRVETGASGAENALFVREPGSRNLTIPSPDDVREVELFSVQALYVYRNGPFDLAGGAGWIRFSGDALPGTPFKAFHVDRPVVPLVASVAPIRFFTDAQWSRVVRFEIGALWIPMRLTARDFGDPVSDFDSPHEFLTRAAVVIDLGALW